MERSFFPQGRRLFARFIPAAVLLTGNLFSTGTLAAGNAGYALDEESIQCIKCHEAFFAEGTPPKVCHKDGCDHPVAVDYARLASTNASLKSPSELDPAIRLFDGRVGCATCHVPYNEYDHLMLAGKRAAMPDIPDPMLNVDNTGSGLCLECHRK